MSYVCMGGGVSVCCVRARVCVSAGARGMRERRKKNRVLRNNLIYIHNECEHIIGLSSREEFKDLVRRETFKRSVFVVAQIQTEDTRTVVCPAC